MATTTTNYGFDVPTSSDLVKNGATAISTLGQDLDTFLFRPFTRNGALNSAFNVWQRGTSFSAAAYGAQTYLADRWWALAGGTSSHSVSRQATSDTTNLPFIQYCMRVQRTAGNTQTTNINIGQDFETVNSIPYAGKQVTFSFYARAGANYSGGSLSYQVRSGTGTDQSMASGYTSSSSFISSSAALTTTWQRFTATATVSGAATQLGVLFFNTPSGTAGANDYWEVTGVMLEVGNQASPYAPATPTYATELAACQRYYYKTSYSPAGGLPIGIGTRVQSTEMKCITYVPEYMRIAPTVTTSAYTTFTTAWGVMSITGINSATNYTGQIGQISFAVGSGTTGVSAFVESANNSCSIEWSAEL